MGTAKNVAPARQIFTYLVARSSTALHAEDNSPFVNVIVQNRSRNDLVSALQSWLEARNIRGFDLERSLRMMARLAVGIAPRLRANYTILGVTSKSVPLVVDSSPSAGVIQSTKKKHRSQPARHRRRMTGN